MTETLSHTTKTLSNKLKNHCHSTEMLSHTHSGGIHVLLIIQESIIFGTDIYFAVDEKGPRPELKTSNNDGMQKQPSLSDHPSMLLPCPAQR